MKSTLIYIFCLLFFITGTAVGMDYDMNLIIESPRRMYGQTINPGIVFRTGVTAYPENNPWYIGGDIGMGNGGGEFYAYSGLYSAVSSFMLQPELGLGWWEQSDSLFSSLKFTVSHVSPFAWKVTGDWDPLSGRVYGISEFQHFTDWKMPWILSIYTGYNFTSYQQGSYYRNKGLSEAGMGLATWAEIGPWYGEISLRSGPDFSRFQLKSFQISCQLLIIYSGR